MVFEEALRKELQTISVLANKVFPLNAIEGTKTPYIVYVSSEGLKYKTFDGFYDPKEIALELNVIHSSYGSMKSLTNEVINLLFTFENRVIGGEGGILVKNLSYDMPIELYEHEVNLFRSVIEVRLHI